MAVTRWARLALAIPTLALTMGGGLRSPARRFPVGSYDSDAYTLSFDAKGSFRYVKGDQLMVEGKYAVHDSIIALTDEKGIDACAGVDRNPGTYRWQLVQKALWFHTIHDQCPDRIRGLADQAWQPHRSP
jgi:hypothetical protein